jgi:hypothetical protein
MTPLDWQTPLWHVSPRVHWFAWHGVSSAAAGSEQLPPWHVPATWH